MANNSFMGQRRRPLMPSFPGSQFRKKNPYFQNVANDPGTAPRAKQVMTLKDRRVLVVYQSDRRARRLLLRLPEGTDRKQLSQVAVGHRYLWFRSHSGASPTFRLDRSALEQAQSVKGVQRSAATGVAPSGG